MSDDGSTEWFPGGAGRATRVHAVPRTPPGSRTCDGDPRPYLTFDEQDLPLLQGPRRRRRGTRPRHQRRGPLARPLSPDRLPVRPAGRLPRTAFQTRIDQPDGRYSLDLARATVRTWRMPHGRRRPGGHLAPAVLPPELDPVSWTPDPCRRRYARRRDQARRTQQSTGARWEALRIGLTASFGDVSPERMGVVGRLAGSKERRPRFRADSEGGLAGGGRLPGGSGGSLSGAQRFAGAKPSERRRL